MPRTKKSSTPEPQSASTSSSKSRRKGPRDAGLPAHLQAQLEAAAKEAAGKPLSMEPGSPLGKLIGSFMEHSLKQELEEHLGYAPHERIDPAELMAEPTAEPTRRRRQNTRNGYGSKTIKTPVGAETIAVPRDRDGSFTPKLLPKHGTVSDELCQRIVGMYAGGMTTRDIAEQIRELYHFEASEDFVSDMVARIDPELKAWRNRPLEEIYAVIYIDALHQKIRHSNGVRSTACYVVSGYGESGTHDVLGIWIAPSEHSDGHGESASFWYNVLNELRSRGVNDVLIACSDGLSGLDKAIAAVFPEAKHINCVVHLVRNALAQVGAQYSKAVAADLKRIYQAPTYEAAEVALEDLTKNWSDRYPILVRQWIQILPALAVLWQFSAALRSMVYTTNPQENINRQMRKVTKNRGMLPSIDSALRLFTLVLMNIDRRAQHRARPDWKAIVTELHIHFDGRLPDDWGRRLV